MVSSSCSINVGVGDVGLVEKSAIFSSVKLVNSGAYGGASVESGCGEECCAGDGGSWDEVGSESEVSSSEMRKLAG